MLSLQFSIHGKDKSMGDTRQWDLDYFHEYKKFLKTLSEFSVGMIKDLRILLPILLVFCQQSLPPLRSSMTILGRNELIIWYKTSGGSTSTSSCFPPTKRLEVSIHRLPA